VAGLEDLVPVLLSQVDSLINGLAIDIELLEGVGIVRIERD
jgi:hypothetical protein